MTKANLVGRMAKDAQIGKKAAEAALDSFTTGVRDSLKRVVTSKSPSAPPASAGCRPGPRLCG